MDKNFYFLIKMYVFNVESYFWVTTNHLMTELTRENLANQPKADTQRPGHILLSNPFP